MPLEHSPIRSGAVLLVKHVAAGQEHCPAGLFSPRGEVVKIDCVVRCNSDHHRRGTNVIDGPGNRRKRERIHKYVVARVHATGSGRDGHRSTAAIQRNAESGSHRSGELCLKQRNLSVESIDFAIPMEAPITNDLRGARRCLVGNRGKEPQGRP